MAVNLDTRKNQASYLRLFLCLLCLFLPLGCATSKDSRVEQATSGSNSPSVNSGGDTEINHITINVTRPEDASQIIRTLEKEPLKSGTSKRRENEKPKQALQPGTENNPAQESTAKIPDAQQLTKKPSSLAEQYEKTARALIKSGKVEQALGYAAKALEIDLEKLGKKHPRVVDRYNYLAQVWKKLGHTKKARQLSESTDANRASAIK